MSRAKQPSAAPSAPTDAPTQEQVAHLITAAEELATELQEAREELRTIRELTQEVHVLRDAIDDVRQELEWAVKNIPRPAWTPTPHVTSMPKDPLAEDFHERVNRFTAKDLPPDNPTPSPAPMSVEQGDLFQ